MGDVLTRRFPYQRFAGQASHPVADDIELEPGDYILHVDADGNAWIIDSDDVATPLSAAVEGTDYLTPPQVDAEAIVFAIALG
jgi:hypothetical protein